MEVWKGKSLPSKSSSHVHHIPQIHIFPMKNPDIAWNDVIPVSCLCREELIFCYVSIHFYTLKPLWGLIQASRPGCNICSIFTLRKLANAHFQINIPAERATYKTQQRKSKNKLKKKTFRKHQAVHFGEKKWQNLFLNKRTLLFSYHFRSFLKLIISRGL